MIPNPQCLKCINYARGCRCVAFSDKIPIEIISGKNKHLKPLKNQKNDIVFEPIIKEPNNVS